MSDIINAPAVAHADFVCVHDGDSMTFLKIHDGDLVYVREQSQVDDGQIAIVAAGDELLIGKIQNHPDCFWLIPGNPMYKSHVFNRDDSSVRILGQAVASLTFFLQEDTESP